MIWVVLIGLGLLVAAMVLMGPRKHAARLRTLIGARVRLSVWGGDLGEWAVESVWTLGVGLHVVLRPLHGRSVDLKIAQGRELRIDARSAEFGWARYVQWGRARVPKVDGATPVRLEILGAIAEPAQG